MKLTYKPLLAALLGLSACAYDATGEDAPPTDETVGVVEQALSGSPVPTRLIISDKSYDGIIQKVYTGNGVVFGANLRGTRGEGWVENHGNSTVNLTLQIVTHCASSTNAGAFFSVSVPPNGSFVQSTRCTSGSATSVDTDFTGISAPGSDIGYTNSDVAMPPVVDIVDTEYDGVITPVSMVGIAPNGVLVVSANLRGTRAEARLENHTNVTITYNSLRASAECANGSIATTVTPTNSVISPGQTVLLEARCASGAATGAYSIFRL
jgi:hypothetical protein